MNTRNNINAPDINTTINMRPELRAKLYEISSLFDIPVSKIIALLIIKIIDKTKIEPIMFETVKYQTRDKLAGYKKLHVSYDKDIYEKANDLRKIIKKSVSRIIAEGMRMFLDEIIRELTKDKKSVDNYLHSYIFIPNYYQKIFYFTIFWASPPHKFLKKYIK